MANWFKRLVAFGAIAWLCVSCSSLASLSYNPWEQLEIPTDNSILDITFSDDGETGWMVGKDSTILKSNDGGDTWETLGLDLGDLSYNLFSVDFYGEEGWIVGKPSLMLHTTDNGEHWSEIPLSAKLPGDPLSVVAAGPDRAEMATDIGAIYRTRDGGRNWKAAVEGAVGVVRSLNRYSPNGSYVSVSAKGNYYSTWSPGQQTWQPINRNSSRRLESMGFTPQGQLWMIERGGQLQFADKENEGEWLEPITPEYEASWGFLDLTYRTEDELWLSGGSGNLLVSFDGGETWEKDRDVEAVPSNLYQVRFFSPEKGFILGQDGIVLRYNSQIAAAGAAAQAEEAG
ncbi:MAG: photosynthesis system II assembly factor Ycf48 [Cyanophyceae cyanobacterium]